MLLRGVKISSVERGMLLAQQGSEDISNHFLASMYLLSRSEGGRTKPMLSKYIQQLFSVTWNVPARIDMSEFYIFSLGPILKQCQFCSSPRWHVNAW